MPPWRSVPMAVTGLTHLSCCWSGKPEAGPGSVTVSEGKELPGIYQKETSGLAPEGRLLER